MQGVRGHARLREVERVHDLRELALAIRALAAVAAGDHRVVEVDRGLPGAGDVDDARRPELAREQIAGEVVDLEAQLEAVLALLAAVAEAEAGVVDEHVDRRQLLREGAHLLEHGEVRQEQVVRAGVVQRLLAALRVTAVDQDGVAGLYQLARERPAEAVGRAGHEDGGHRLHSMIDPVRLAHEYFGLDTTATPLPGEHDLNYGLEERHVLKVHRPGADLSFEDAVLEHLRDEPFAPHLLGRVQHEDRVVRLLSWLPGRVWADRPVTWHRSAAPWRASIGRSRASGSGATIPGSCATRATSGSTCPSSITSPTRSSTTTPTSTTCWCPTRAS